MQIMFVWSILNTDSIMGYFCMFPYVLHSFRVKKVHRKHQVKSPAISSYIKISVFDWKNLYAHKKITDTNLGLKLEWKWGFMGFLWHMESDFLFSDWDYLTIDIYGLSATNQPDALGEKTQSHNKTNLTNITETKIRFF